MQHARTDYQGRVVDVEGKIPENEPVFLIRGQDAVGAEAVRAWATLNELAGGDSVLTRLARAQADRMDEWPFRKLADLHPLGGTRKAT